MAFLSIGLHTILCMLAVSVFICSPFLSAMPAPLFFFSFLFVEVRTTTYCVCVFFPFILHFNGRTSRGHTGRR